MRSSVSATSSVATTSEAARVDRMCVGGREDIRASISEPSLPRAAAERAMMRWTLDARRGQFAVLNAINRLHIQSWTAAFGQLAADKEK